MQVTLNGESREFPAALTVSELLSTLALDARKVAIERNQSIVPRSQFGAVRLADGDALEIVQFIGGG